MKLTQQQFAKYLEKVKNRPFFIRHGQALVNELYLIDFDLASEVTSQVDPFSVDGRIPAFLDALSKYIVADSTINEI